MAKGKTSLVAEEGVVVVVGVKVVATKELAVIVISGAVRINS